jgi:hypothetical protein
VSVARAVSVEVPCGAFFQAQRYGALVSVARASLLDPAAAGDQHPAGVEQRVAAVGPVDAITLGEGLRSAAHTPPRTRRRSSDARAP